MEKQHEQRDGSFEKQEIGDVGDNEEDEEIGDGFVNFVDQAVIAVPVMGVAIETLIVLRDGRTLSAGENCGAPIHGAIPVRETVIRHTAMPSRSVRLMAGCAIAVLRCRPSKWG